MIRGRNKHLKAITPEISLRSTYTSYYIHNNHIYPIAGSPSNCFREAVYAHVGKEWDDSVCKLLEATDIDLVSRWYILNRLIEKNKPMKLYPSKSEAEKICTRV